MVRDAEKTEVAGLCPPTSHPSCYQNDTAGECQRFYEDLDVRSDFSMATSKKSARRGTQSQRTTATRSSKRTAKKTANKTTKKAAKKTSKKATTRTGRGSRSASTGVQSQLDEANANTRAVIRVVESIRQAQSVQSAAQVALDSVRASLGWDYGCYWSVQTEMQALQLEIESGVLGDEFGSAASSQRPRKGQGSAGNAWMRSELLFLPELTAQSDPLTQGAIRCGARSSCSFPVVVCGEIVGVMEFYMLSAQQPSAERLEALSHIGLLISSAMERLVAESEVKGLLHAGASGRLDERVDAARFSGVTRDMLEGVNSLLDAVVAPMKESLDALNALANGDLTGRVRCASEGHHERMRNGINHSMDRLAEMVSQIRITAGSLAQGAGDITVGNQDLTQRMAQQASSLEKTAASMEEMTATVRQTADNSKKANELSLQCREVAEQGGCVVQTAVASMSEINKASSKISDIIGVIDEIAFQTNLLALNAAVEAARAGEQGRGFAVVAAEVRNLAQRSAEAAKEIKNLIQDSVQKVEEGSRLVNQSGASLDEIVQSVKHVVEIIAEITAASQEQSIGIEQVNEAVGQLDQITQQNAALVEETAAASRSMSRQSQELKVLVEQFKLDPDTQRSITAQEQLHMHREPGVSFPELRYPEPSYLEPSYPGARYPEPKLSDSRSTDPLLSDPAFLEPSPSGPSFPRPAFSQSQYSEAPYPPAPYSDLALPGAKPSESKSADSQTPPPAPSHPSVPELELFEEF